MADERRKELVNGEDITFYEDPQYPGKRNPDFKATMVDHEMMAPPRKFEDFKDRYKVNWNLDRTEDGIVTAKWHTDGEDLQYNLGFHRSMGQLMEDIGQDPDCEVLIMGGSGDTFLKKTFTLINEQDNMDWMAYEHMFYDGPRMLNAIVNNLRIPTIGIINGDGYHTELALMCDITLMADDAVISDPHFCMGGVPGDGIQIALRQCMGWKRANYAMMTFEQIDAKTAKEYGLVNEIVPKEKIYERAMQIAKYYMTKPRQVRRIASEIMKQPMSRALADELRYSFGMEMWTFFTNHNLDHENGFRLIDEWRKMYEGKED